MDNRNQWIQISAPIIGRNLTDNIATHRFKTTFGTTEDVVALELWPVIHPRIFTILGMKNFQPIHLLWGLMFLRKYYTEEEGAQIVGVKSKFTYRKWAKAVIIQIAMMRPEVVS